MISLPYMNAVRIPSREKAPLASIGLRCQEARLTLFDPGFRRKAAATLENPLTEANPPLSPEANQTLTNSYRRKYDCHVTKYIYYKRKKCRLLAFFPLFEH